MPSIKWASVPLIMMCLALGACDSGDTIDTSKVEKSFSSAQPTSKQAVDDLKAAVAAKDYGKASAALQKLAASASLTSDQKQAIQDVTAQVTKKVAEKSKELAKEGEKAVGDMQKRLSN